MIFQWLQCPENTSFTIPLMVKRFLLVVSTHIMGSIDGTIEMQGIYPPTNNTVYIKALDSHSNITPSNYHSYVLIINT